MTSTNGGNVDPGGNGDPGDDSEPTVTSLAPDATIGLAKSVVLAGRTATIDFYLLNTGNALASGVSVTDDLDEVFGAGNYRVAVAPAWPLDPGTLTLNGAFTGSPPNHDLLDPGIPTTNTLAAGAEARIRLVIEITRFVDRGFGVGTYRNTARSASTAADGTTFTDDSQSGTDVTPDGDGDPTNDSDPTDFGVGVADLEVIKTGPATAQVGDTIVYTISVANAGPGTALDVRVFDKLPEGVTFLDASDGGVQECGVITWPTVTVIAPDSAVVRTVRVLTDGVGLLTNIASATSLFDPDSTNNDGTNAESQTQTTVDVAVADLRLTKVGPANANLGDTVTYVITVTNDGPDQAEAVVVTDSLPMASAFVGASRGGSFSGRRVTFPALPSLAAGATLVDSVRVVLPEVGSFRDVATVTSSTSDPEPGNNDDTNPDGGVTTTTRPVDLSITKRLTSPLRSGEEATYEIVVTNVGVGRTVGAITVVDSLPQGLTFVSASPAGWSCSSAGSVVTCVSDEVLLSGESRLLTLTTLVSAAPGATLRNVATVGTPGEDPGEDNRAETEDDKVLSPGELLLEKKSSATLVRLGDLVRYDILLRNVGESVIDDVTIEDNLPSGFSLVPGTSRIDGSLVPEPQGAPGPRLTLPGR